MLRRSHATRTSRCRPILGSSVRCVSTTSTRRSTTSRCARPCSPLPTNATTWPRWLAMPATGARAFRSMPARAQRPMKPTAASCQGRATGIAPNVWSPRPVTVAEAGYKGERVVLLDPADIPQLHAEALVTEQLLKKLGLNVELATNEWGTIVKRVLVKEPIDQGGWNVFGTAFAIYDMLNPATNRNLRAPGATGYSLPGWATDEAIEDLRKAWFAADDEAQRRDLADKIQRRAFEIGLYLPIGQLVGHRAFRNSLSGIPDSPITVLWNIQKR